MTVPVSLPTTWRAHGATMGVRYRSMGDKLCIHTGRRHTAHKGEDQERCKVPGRQRRNPAPHLY